MAEDMISNILVAIDGSDVSLRAASYAIGLAKREGAKLAVLHVIHLPASGLMYTTESAFSQSIEKSRKGAEGWFEGIRKTAEGAGLDVKTETMEELYSVPGAIIKKSEELGADLVIVGGSGLSGFKRFFLGSVASDVVRYSRCPVLVVK